jgi:type I restriction enzyme S subunit
LIEPRYAILCLCSPRCQDYFHKSAKPAIAQASINQTDVAQCLIGRPQNLAEQQQIADIAAVMQHREKCETASLEKLKLQKRGLMHDLLTGRVPV